MPVFRYAVILNKGFLFFTGILAQLCRQDMLKKEEGGAGGEGEPAAGWGAGHIFTPVLKHLCP